MDLLTTYTPLGTTNNYNATTISTNHKTTTVLLNIFQPAVPSLDVLWQRLLTVEILQLQETKFFLHSLWTDYSTLVSQLSSR
jgi:hypothetical protein